MKFFTILIVPCKYLGCAASQKVLVSKGVSRRVMMEAVVAPGGFLAAGGLLWARVPGNARSPKREGDGRVERCGGPVALEGRAVGGQVEEDLPGQEKWIRKIGFAPCHALLEPQRRALPSLARARDERERAKEVFYSLLAQV